MLIEKRYKKSGEASKQICNVAVHSDWFEITLNDLAIEMYPERTKCISISKLYELENESHGKRH